MFLRRIPPPSERAAYEKLHRKEECVVVAEQYQWDDARETMQGLRQKLQMTFDPVIVPRYSSRSTEQAWGTALEKIERDPHRGLIVLTGTGGIRLRQQIISIITQGRIADVLEHSSMYPEIAKETARHLWPLYEALDHTPQVRVVSADGLEDEFFRHRGGGTLAINLESTRFDHARGFEEDIFYAVVRRQMSIGNFNPKRSHEQLETLWHHHWVLRTGLEKRGSPIAGVSVEDHEDETTSISTLWSDVTRQGIGEKVLQNVDGVAGATSRRLVALSTNHAAIKLFVRCGYENYGPLSEAKKKHKEIVPERYMRYDTRQRNPELLIRSRPEEHH